VERTVFSFESLLLGSESTEWWGDESDDETRESVPSEGSSWSLPSYKLGQFSTEEGHIKDWFKDVDVEGGKTSGPFLSILGQSLVWVGDTVVEVTDLVVMHLL